LEGGGRKRDLLGRAKVGVESKRRRDRGVKDHSGFQSSLKKAHDPSEGKLRSINEGSSKNLKVESMRALEGWGGPVESAK